MKLWAAISCRLSLIKEPEMQIKAYNEPKFRKQWREEREETEQKQIVIKASEMS